MSPEFPPLTPEEQERFSWQTSIPGMGEIGQQKLKQATVLISRVGGVGGCVAQQLAAAGVGRLILLHGGKLRVDDLNRQILMSDAAIGTDRVECAAARLRAINPSIEIVSVSAHPNEQNTLEYAAQAQLVISAAPLFTERHALHAAAASHGIPCIEAAMYELEGYVTVVHPPNTARYDAWCPAQPDWWQRRFPVWGAVSGTIGALAAVEALKVLTGVGEPLYNRMLAFDFRTGRAREVKLPK